MTEPQQQVELWPCGYVARCSARECRRRATTIMRYLDNQGDPIIKPTPATTTRANSALT